MKYAIWVVATLLILSLAYVALQMAASERVEVVELHTLNEAGEDKITRLWVVDHNGFPYIRAGHNQSSWYLRLNPAKTIELTRSEKTIVYQAIPDINSRNTINRLMQEKYTWGETFIGSLFNRDASIPIKLIAESPVAINPD